MHFFRIAVWSFFLISGWCQAQTTFYKTYGHVTGGSEGRNIIQAADGGYFLSYYIYYASHAHACITKINCGGEKEWEKFFSRSGNTLPVEIVALPDQGCLLSLSAQVSGGQWRHYVVRLDSLGNQLWSRGLNMRVGNQTNCMARSGDGSIYLCGGVDIGQTGKTGTTLVKLDEAGNILWIRNFYDDHYQVPRCLAVNNGGDIAVAGSISYSGWAFVDGFVFLCDPDGKFIRRKVFSTTYDDETLGICADKNGNFCITGYAYFINHAWDVFVHILSPDLDILKSRFYDAGTPQGEQARHITAASGGGVAVFGDEGGFNERNLMLLRLNEDGDLLWSKRYTVSPLFTNYLFYGSQADDGGFLMTGDVRPLTQFRIAPVIKTSADGEAGCYTADLQITARTDTVIVTDTVMLSSLVVDFIDTSFFPAPVFPLQTDVTNYCANEKPCGNFTAFTDTLCPRACYSFKEKSMNAGTMEWFFENGTPSYYAGSDPPVVCFNTEGPHEVTYRLTNDSGTVEYTKSVSGKTACPFQIPNIFTPDEDGINDVFYARGLHESFSLMIMNRWGIEVFSADLPGKWWNGKLPSGADAAEGTYFYQLQIPGKNQTWKGTVYLKRKV